MNISSGIESIQECIICTTVDNQRDTNFEKNLGLIPPYEVRYCESCRLRWLSPRPTTEVYSEIYSNQDYLSSVESYSDLAEKRAPYFRDRVKKIEKYFINHMGLKILELGAATGEFVNEALLLGHKAIGIEPSIESREIALKLYGVELVDAKLDQFPDFEFDVIHMNHVFEHLSYPFEVLADCNRLLKENGLIVIEVPQQIYNDLDRLKKIIGLKKTPKFDVYSLHHTYFYTPHSIASLLYKAGYKIDRLVTSNAKRTPIRPFKSSNMLLLAYLWLSDKVHKGGNIIEVYARKM